MTAGQAFPASYGQQALWLLGQLAPGEARYQLGVEIPLPPPDGALVTAALVTEAWATVVRRHETLRTALELRDGDLVQVVHREVPVDVPHTDLADLDPDTQRDRLRDLVAAATATPIPLETAPLWRARGCRLAADRWSLVLAGSHTILDASSLIVLAADLREAVAAAVGRRPPRLPELAIQYADYAAWQRGEVEAGRLAEDLAYWRGQLAGLPAHHRLPTDRPRPAVLGSAGGQRELEVDAGTVRRLREVARGAGTTPFVVLLAALAALVGRLSGDTDVAIGTPVSGRDLPELEPLVGLLVNTLVLRVDLGGDPTFAELLARCRGTVLDALDHQAVPFDLLVGELAPRRTPSWNPLYQIGLNVLSERGLGGGFGYSTVDTSAGTADAVARFDLHLDVIELPGRMVGVLEHARDLFDDASAAAFADRYVRLLGAAVADPGCAVSRLPLLDDAERAALRGRPRAVGPPVPVLDHLADLAAQTPDAAAVRGPAAGAPDAVAVGGPGAGLTRAGLAGRAAALRDRLPAGTGPVAVLLPPDDPGWAEAVLAVLGAGRAVLPLPAGLPAPRRGFLLADARPSALITTGEPGPLPPDLPILTLDPPGAGSTVPPVGGGPGGGLVVYPAGAGLPRGLVIGPAALSARVAQVVDAVRARPGARWSGPPPGDPDGVVLLLAALAAGGSTGPAADADVVVAAAPVPPGWGTAVAVGGRVLLGWPETGPAFLAQPGPGESGVGEPGLGEPGGGAVPLDAVGAAVLDRHGEPVPTGVEGDLHVTGPALADGYLGRPGPTAERFGPDPAGDSPSDRRLRTGARARRLPDGTIQLAAP